MLCMKIYQTWVQFYSNVWLQWQSVTNCLFNWQKRNVHWNGTAFSSTRDSLQVQPCTQMHVNEWNQRICKGICTSNLHDFSSTKDFLICWDMCNDHLRKFVFNLLNVSHFMLLKLCAVTCDSRHVMAQCTLILCQWSKRFLLITIELLHIGVMFCQNLMHFHAQHFVWWCVEILSVSFLA